jgi:hypothetical protein
LLERGRTHSFFSSNPLSRGVSCHRRCRTDPERRWVKTKPALTVPLGCGHAKGRRVLLNVCRQRFGMRCADRGSGFCLRMWTRVAHSAGRSCSSESTWRCGQLVLVNVEAGKHMAGRSDFYKAGWYVEEYRQRSGEISKHLDREQQLLNNGLLALGGVTAFLGAIHSDWGSWVCPLGLFLGFFFITMAVHHMRYDLFIAYNAQYIEENIRVPAVGAGVLHADYSLRWDRFVSARRAPGRRGRLLHVALFVSRVAPLVLASAAFIAWAIWWAVWEEMPHGVLAWAAVILGVLAVCGWVAFVLVGIAVDREADKVREESQPANAKAAATKETWKRLIAFCQSKKRNAAEEVNKALTEYLDREDKRP